ncbi:MAG TPA: hypothetical protein VFO41_17990 [Alphaproteobacteria bacterium]|nr:hypothetical protein [Alphaproteobacteria bacterium]
MPLALATADAAILKDLEAAAKADGRSATLVALGDEGDGRIGLRAERGAITGLSARRCGLTSVPATIGRLAALAT